MGSGYQWARNSNNFSALRAIGTDADRFLWPAARGAPLERRRPPDRPGGAVAYRSTRKPPARPGARDRRADVRPRARERARQRGRPAAFEAERRSPGQLVLDPSHSEALARLG